MMTYFGAYSLLLILLALTIGVMSSYTMFYLIGNHKFSVVHWRKFGIIGGAAVFGLGLSTATFLVQLASNTMIMIDWSMSLMLLTGMLLALLSVLVLRSRLRFIYRLVTSSLILSLASCGLLFWSLLSGASNRFMLQEGSVLVAFIVSWIGGYLAYFLFERKLGNYILNSSALLGCSMLLTQFIALEAVTVEHSQILTADRLNENLTLLAILLGLGTLLVIGFSLMVWYANNQLVQVGDRYKLLVENSIDMIATYSEGQWNYVNQSGLRMFEAQSSQELIGKSIYAFLHPKHHKSARERQATLQSGVTFGPVEQEWYTAKGKLLHTEVVEVITTVAGRPAVQIIIRDITERKKNEELLINSEKLYVAGQLAAGIAHEIRNPLTSLKGFLQLMASGRGTSKNYYDIMNSELARIETIVSELLMLSKPQIYDLAYKDANRIMAETVTLLEGQAILHNIELHLQYSEEPLWIHGVENQIKQVFINVLKNAIEAMLDGGEIIICCEQEEQEILVRIEDHGPGIGEEQLSKMGQPFYTTKEKGTGLGLMVSYKIVDNHQGRIDVRSQIGAGTVFEIRLPYAEPPVHTEVKQPPKLLLADRAREK